MPTKKNNKLNLERSQRKQKIDPLFLILGGVIMVLIISLIVFNDRADSYAPEITGSPALQVDKEIVDLGNIQLGKMVNTSFEIRNIGDQDLRFTNKPYVEVKAGC